jgi:FkbM family methyltransferase
MKRPFMRQAVRAFRNSYFHYFICWALEKFEMEGFTLSYAQCGEDLILKKIFGKNSRNGFYIDIGCNNPIQKSNTFKLYLKGWKGICIDGNANLVNKFKRIRRRDNCLNAIVSDNQGTVTFFQDNVNHELSSVDIILGKELTAANKEVQLLEMTSVTLESILDTHLSADRIDLLCIDVEGHDLQVLKGNNFEKYRPRIIVIEFEGSIEDVKRSEADRFLVANGYELLVLSSPNIYYENKVGLCRQ